MNELKKRKYIDPNKPKGSTIRILKTKKLNKPDSFNDLTAEVTNGRE